MRLLVAAVGRLKAGPDRELAERYRERAVKAGRTLGFKALDILEIPESRADSVDQRIRAEGMALAKVIPPEAAVVILDAAGRSLTSDALAAEIGRWRDNGRPAIAFGIGGADGLDPVLKRRAGLVLAFGAATWPHQLVRIMLLEQLYRAVTILAGHPYHRA